MKALKCTLVTTSLALLAACGGGGGGGGTVTNSIALQGVAATGAAISGGTVDVKCKNGTSAATTNSDGTYTVTVAEGAQPCVLKATDPVTKVELFSIVESGGTTANITPVTSLVVANALGDSPAAIFSNFNSSVYEKITPTSISAAVTRIQAATAALGADADMSGVDVMKGTLVAATDNVSGNAHDRKIDALMAALAAADKRVADLTNQLKNATSAVSAATGLTTVVGAARYSLANCPYARSGDVWALNFAGDAPVAFNANFDTMVLRRLSNGATSTIEFKRDASGNPIACAFTTTTSGATTEFRISEGGIGAWRQSSDFGLVVPAQKSWQLMDSTFTGSYPALAFVKEKLTGHSRFALPISFEVDARGELKSYQCDMARDKPVCISPIDTSNADATNCSPLSNGTFSCTSTSGMSAIGILYATGSQATMFMSITNMPVSGRNFGGLLVMTKAAKISLPTVGQIRPADFFWYAGVNAGANIVSSNGTLQTRVESVDTVNNSFTSSVVDSPVIQIRQLDTPANGFLFLRAGNSRSVILSSPTGWSVTASGAGSSAFDGWYAHIRARR